MSEAEFWKRVSQGDGCWPWTGKRHSATKWKYGIVAFRGRHVSAHRVAWILTYGEIPKGKLICHKCDNPPCCRPDHLFLGTPKSNMEDMAQKGRTKSPFKPKLTTDQVKAIRQEHADGSGIRPLARIYNVTPAAICFIVHGQRRRWV